MTEPNKIKDQLDGLGLTSGALGVTGDVLAPINSK